jgi:hypothetical protein
VFINGARLLPTDYTATNGTTVVLGTGALLNDAVTVLNYTSTIAALPTSRDVIDYTATAAQTTFTVSGGYVVGLLDVYVNGSKLTAAEFTATNGTTFVLTDASVVGNQVQAIRYNASVTGISGSGTANYVPKFTASQTVGNSLIFDNGTHIGIGTATPNLTTSFGRALSLVASTGYAGVEIYGASATGGAQLDFGGSATRFASITGEYESSTNGYLNIRTLRAGTLTDALRISANGNVGVGTTSPSGASGTTLEINGAAGQARLAIKNNATGSGSLNGLQFGVDTGGGAFIEQRGSNSLQLGTNSIGRLFITSDGRVAIGSTTPEPGVKFLVSDGGGIGMEFSPNANVVGENRLLSYNRAAFALVPMNYTASVHKFLGGAITSASGGITLPQGTWVTVYTFNASDIMMGTFSFTTGGTHASSVCLFNKTYNGGSGALVLGGIANQGAGSVQVSGNSIQVMQSVGAGTLGASWWLTRTGGN